MGRTSGRAAPALAALLAGALIAAGCGDDDDGKTTSVDFDEPVGVTGPTGASGEDGEEGAAIDLEDATASLEDAGFTVEEQRGDSLAQEPAGGIEATAGLRVFKEGEPADAVIQQFESTEDAESAADSLESNGYTAELRDDVVAFALADEQELLDEVVAAAEG